MQASARPRVVIVGAGFGGLTAVQSLAKVRADVALIDRQNHHCFQPLLYQVATAALSPADVAWPIRSILNRQGNVLVLLGEVSAIDLKKREVHTDGFSLPYDYLVLSTGVSHSYFGHDEWAPFAPGLKTLDDARVIRRRFLLAFEEAERAQSERDRARLLNFAIVGGGPTGIELAGAFAEVACRTLPGDFRRIDPRRARIIVIEAGPRVLAQFPPELSDYALSALRRMGVEVLLSSPVTQCDGFGVTAGGKRIEAATIIWAAGVAASSAGAWIGAECDRAGRIKVNPDLTVPGHPEIFAIGDCAGMTDESGHPLPGVAQVAKQMGQYAAGVIASRIALSPPPAPFRFHDYGDLATIGRKAAVVKIGRIELTGFIGWWVWSVAHIYFLIGVKNRLFVAATWLWSYVTFKRGARLILDAEPSDCGKSAAH